MLSRQKADPDEITEEKWVADFSKEKHARFDIKSESSYDASLRKNIFNSGYSLALSLKKEGCIAWTEDPEHRYSDLVFSGSLRIDARGGYGAGGILFRMVDSETYYSLLISNKGYFRLDAVRNGMPFPLVGWTEIPLSKGMMLTADEAVDFSLIAYGSRIIIIIRGRWAAEVNDSSILEGTLCFTAASYEAGDLAYRVIRDTENLSYTSEAFLESFELDSRISEVSALYEKWKDSQDIDPKARLNLAETFTAMGQYNAAMVQLNKAWAASGNKKTQTELLLAGRLAQHMGLMNEAESYISQCFQADVESREGKEAVVEMAKILYASERFKELKDYCFVAVKMKPNDPMLWTFRGHALWNFGKYKNAVAAYNKAFELDRENGIHAKNAANVYDVMGSKKEALSRYIDAGRAFLNAGNYNDLGLLVPKLLSMGEDNWEARSLIGKWAYAIEDWSQAKTEFRRAEEIRKTRRPKPPRDGAQVFLEALLLIMEGRRREALPLLEEAVALEKNYALFHFRLAENLFILEDNPKDPVMLKEMNTAISLLKKEAQGRETSKTKMNEGLAGWVNNFAAQVALRKEDLVSAAQYLEKASDILGDLPEVRVNRGMLYFLRGSPDEAIAVLTVESRDDPEGIVANCAGNLLVRSGRYEEADERYRQALAAAPNNVEFICNRANCLIELGFYGEADRLMAQAHTIAPSPTLLEMISYVAIKKGEYQRAEQACLSALEMDPNHAPSLLSLGWVYLTLGRKEDTGEIIRRLDALTLGEDTLKSREELRAKLDELLHQYIKCASCDISWKVPRDPPSVPSLRLFAMPPDNLPAGSCLKCGSTYCIGCAKGNLDPQGRFICASCNETLKLMHNGLKSIVHEWGSKEGLIKAETLIAERPLTGPGRRKKSGKPKASS